MSKEIHIITETDYDMNEIEAIFEDEETAIEVITEMNRRVPGHRYLLGSYEISEAGVKVLDYFEARVFSDDTRHVEWLAKGKSSFCFSDTEAPDTSIDSEEWWGHPRNQGRWHNGNGAWAVRASGSNKAEVVAAARKRAKELKDKPAPES